MTQPNIVAITGATGYLGSVLSEHLSGHGADVIALTRRPPEDHAAQWRPFDLGEPVDGALFDGVDSLIHAAWVLSGKDTNELWRQNVLGSRRLIEAAIAAGVPKIVFVSSMSAYFGTRQAYGLMKLAVERTVLDSGGVVVRPGLVYGETPGGMAGTLRRISGLPLWPHFGSARLFLAHEDDIAAALAKVLDDYASVSGSVLGFANAAPLELSAILSGLSLDNRRRPGVPVPATLVMGSLKLLETAGVPFPFRSDSLLGLVKGADFLPGQELLAQRGIRFRALST